MNKLTYKIFSLLFLLFVPFLTYFSYCYGDTCSDGDLLNCTFEPSRAYDTIIDYGNDKRRVGESFLNSSNGFSWGSGFYQNAPVIVKIVKIILKITVVLSVTMVIYYGVKFMLQVFKGDDLKSASAKKDLINLFIGLLIALFSITAVTLVISIPRSSMELNEIPTNSVNP